MSSQNTARSGGDGNFFKNLDNVGGLSLASAGAADVGRQLRVWRCRRLAGGSAARPALRAAGDSGFLPVLPRRPGGKPAPRVDKRIVPSRGASSKGRRHGGAATHTERPGATYRVSAHRRGAVRSSPTGSCDATGCTIDGVGDCVPG